MISPLAKGEAMQEVENIVRFIEMLKMLGGDELVGLEIDIPAAAGRLGDLMNVPMDVRNSKDKKVELQKKFAAQQVQAQGGSPEQAQAAEGQVEQLEARRA